jgi:hypothetical protein
LPRDRDYQKRGVLRCRTPLEKLTSGLPKGSPSRPERCLNANRQSDSFTSLEIAPRNSNHIPGGTAKGTTVVPTLRGAWTGGQRVGPRCAVLARLYVRDGSWLCENADVRKPMEGSSLRTACKSRSTALNAAGRAAHKQFADPSAGRGRSGSAHALAGELGTASSVFERTSAPCCCGALLLSRAEYRPSPNKPPDQRSPRSDKMNRITTIRPMR